MRTKWIALLIASYAATPAFAQIETQMAGEWTVQTRHDDPTVDPSCVLISPRAESDVSMQLTNPVRLTDGETKVGNAALAVYVVTAEKRDTATLPQVSIKIDSLAEWTSDVVLKPIDTGYAFTAILESDIRKILKPMAMGNALQVSYKLDGTQAEEKTISLAGSSAALALYKDCLSKVQVK